VAAGHLLDCESTRSGGATRLLPASPLERKTGGGGAVRVVGAVLTAVADGQVLVRVRVTIARWPSP